MNPASAQGQQVSGVRKISRCAHRFPSETAPVLPAHSTLGKWPGTQRRLPPMSSCRSLRPRTNSSRPKVVDTRRAFASQQGEHESLRRLAECFSGFPCQHVFCPPAWQRSKPANPGLSVASSLCARPGSPSVERRHPRGHGTEIGTR